MKSLSVVFFTLSLIVMLSCPHETVAQKESEIDAWLNKISGGKPPETDITGRWHDTQGSGMFTWGEGYLRQEQGKVSGAIGSYDVRGGVSGKIVRVLKYWLGKIRKMRDGAGLRQGFDQAGKSSGMRLRKGDGDIRLWDRGQKLPYLLKSSILSTIFWFSAYTLGRRAARLVYSPAQ